MTTHDKTTKKAGKPYTELLGSRRRPTPSPSDLLAEIEDWFTGTTFQDVIEEATAHGNEVAKP
jgi:hypothetical protein